MFKLISGLNIVGVVTLNDFRKWQQKHNSILFSDADHAQYVEYKGVLYRDSWLKATTTDDIEYINVSIVPIDEDEYNALVEALETEDEIEIDNQEEQVEPIEPVDETEEATLAFVKEMKIAQMSKMCNQTIVNGIDVVLSDGETHHFSLEITDQIKIQALALKAQNGTETLFWHEDDKLCQFYSASDILTIYAALEAIQTFETTYFNSLKMYIMELDNIEEVSAITYGIDIPVEYQSEVLKYLLQQRQQSNSNSGE